MKIRFFFTMLLFTVSSISFAQFKVASSGKVTIERPDPVPAAILTVGKVNFSTYNNYRFGILSNVSVYNAQQYNIGVSGKADSQSATCNIGVQGLGSSASSGRNIGVLGGINSSTSNGAGIFGTIGNHIGVNLSDRYAGYFDGLTKVDGSLYVTSGIYGSLMTESATMPGYLSENAIQATERTAFGDRIAELSAIAYYKTPYSSSRNMVENSDSTDTIEPISKMARQIQDKKHYGFSAEQLETLFPDLVYEMEDGTKVINYVEMIPLLVESINDLRAQINSLSSDNNNENINSRSVSFINEKKSTTLSSAIIATLAQNTPNPFSERTTIRFTLPEKAQNAYIYVFDMSGKMQKQIPVDSSMQSVTIEGYELSAGMYIYSLVIGGKEIQTRRMILSK